LRTIKIISVTVAALFLLMVFQNSYSQSNAIAEAKETKIAQPATEVSSPAEPKDIVSDSGPIQSVPGPPLSGSVTQPRAQYAITEALLMVVAFIILGLIAVPVVCLSPLLLLIFLCVSPLFLIVNVIFIFLIMVLPVLLASFADVSSYEIPGSVQRMLNDIGSKGTLTEIAFAYLKNLWSIVVNLPEVARLVGNLDTGDYAHLIERFGSIVLNYPRNIRALPNKILHNLFPTVNALPAWLRQAPVLLQVFPLLMYALMVLPIVALIGYGFILALGLAVTIGLLPILLLLSAPLLIIFGGIILGLLGLVFGVSLGLAAGIVMGGIVLLAILGLIMIICAVAGILLGAIIGAIIGIVVATIIALILVAAGILTGPIDVIIIVAALIGIVIGGGLGILIGGILGLVIGGGLGFIIGLLLGGIAFIAIVLCLMAVGFALGACLGVLGAFIGLVVAALLLLVLIPLSIVMVCIALPIVLFLIPILGGAFVLLTLPLMLPVGPQAVKSYPAVFSLCLSFAENSISIPLGCCVGLPASACLSFFRGLPGSMRAVLIHLIDFCLTPFLFAMRALPLMGTFVVLAILWIAGMGLFTVFSPFILIAPVFIVLALFAQGLIDRSNGEDVSAIDTDEIKKSIDNLPENVGEVDRVIKRIAEMVGKSATTDIKGLLDALLDVDWLIATQNLPYVLPEAMQAVGGAVPSIIESCPDIIKTLIDSGLSLTIYIFEYLSETLVAWITDIIAIIVRMPEFALLIPQMLEILSVITINLPALVRGFIPAAVDAVEETGKGLPELFPSIVLSTMGLNALVLQFARGVWRLSMRVSELIIQFLWYLILLLPASIFDFDKCVTPWFGPRLFSVIGLCIGAIPAGCIGLCSALGSLLIAGCLEVGVCCYIPSMLVMQILTLITDAMKFCIMPCTTIVSIVEALIQFFTIFGGIIDAIIQYPISQVIVDTCTGILGIINAILEPITAILDMIGAAISGLSLLTEWLLPIFFLILVVIALFPLMGIVVAFLTLALIYFGFYLGQIFVGSLLMACSGVFQSVVMVPLMALCEPVPVVSTLLGYMNTLTGFYAFFIPPNVIEIITQSIPLCVNLLAACPVIVFMPISLVQTFFSTASSAVGALPSVPAYLGRLTDRIIFSFCAECLAIISFAIDLFVAVVLSCFAITTGMLDELLSLDILTNAPKIAILVLALIFVIFAWVIDLCGVMCLRAPDMINEYANAILKSMAMMPILSAIVPGMAAAPAAMQPEVVSAGLSKLAIIVVLSPCAILGAFVTLVYNLFKEVFMWFYGTAPSLFLLPCNLCGRAMDSVNRICSGMGSALGGAGNSIENQLVTYGE
jgi:hypothetical protein